MTRAKFISPITLTHFQKEENAPNQISEVSWTLDQGVAQQVQVLCKPVDLSSVPGPRHGRREITPESCPLSFICLLCRARIHREAHMY